MNKAPLPLTNFFVTSNNNNKYSVEIVNESNYLNILIKTIDKIPSITYNNKFSLEDIKQLNKYFLTCTNISEVLILIEPFLQNTNNISLIEKTNEINLIINISFPLSPQIIFNIKANTKNINETINELYEIINNQNNKINEQNNQLNKLNNQLNNQNNKINEQNNQLNKLNNQLNNQNNKINKQNNQLKEQKDEISLLRKEIKKKPIGIIEKNDKIYECYTKQQFEENNYKWYDI
jgi:uncharacterized coiled-coil protein SlyX